MHYHFEGRLTARDCKRHIPHSFAVPAGQGRIDLRLRFAPYRVHRMANMLTLTVFDPAGFRGAGHRDGQDHRVSISLGDATPGYLPGPLPAGEWIAQVDTHMIMPGEVTYGLDITIAEEATAGERAAAARTAPGEWPRPFPAVKPSRGAPLRGAGWYRGDLHTHTHHSDAGRRSVAALVRMAREAGLDFVFLTDHNTTAGLAEMDALSTDDLLTAGGIELTTFWGHALCLGKRAWVDWRIRPGAGEMGRIAADIGAGGQVFIIAHPESAGDPGCTGCKWRFGDMMPGNARLVEIWNGPWDGDSGNEAALALWYDWLNQGLRLAATAGTDTHGGRDYARPHGFNVVYAEALEESALLTALRAGHLYLSAGPRLSFQAQGEDGRTVMMGDAVLGPANLVAEWAGCPADARMRLIANGRLYDQRPAADQGSRVWPIAPDLADWVVAEIRDGKGAMLAVTNPIYLQ